MSAYHVFKVHDVDDQCVKVSLDELIVAASSELGLTPDRLCEIAAAEQEGQIPKLKLGDKVYWIAGKMSFLYGEIAEFTISMISSGARTNGWKYRASALSVDGYENHKTKHQHDFNESDIGEIYYITREEAAAALAEKGAEG